MSAGQKRAPDLITDGCEPPCGCWELNSGPLEEEAMLLTAEPSLQPQDCNIVRGSLSTGTQWSVWRRKSHVKIHKKANQRERPSFRSEVWALEL